MDGITISPDSEYLVFAQFANGTGTRFRVLRSISGLRTFALLTAVDLDL